VARAWVYTVDAALVGLMRAGSVRATRVPAGSPVSTVPTATSIARTLIGVGIVTALTARQAAIPLAPARSLRTGSVPGSYRRLSSTDSFLFRPACECGCHRCNRQRHAVEHHSSSRSTACDPLMESDSCESREPPSRNLRHRMATVHNNAKRLMAVRCPAIRC